MFIEKTKEFLEERIMFYSSKAVELELEFLDTLSESQREAYHRIDEMSLESDRYQAELDYIEHLVQGELEALTKE